MKKESTNLEIPSRWRRFFAYLLDIIINITGIWLIINIIITLIKRITLWNMLAWIKTINEDNNKIWLWKTFLRYFVFYSTLFVLFFLTHIILSVILRWHGIFCHLGIDDILCDIHNILLKSSEIVFVIILINVVEIFFKCPTFIDKWLWIKRIYKKSKSNE